MENIHDLVDARSSGQELQLVVFRLAKEEYGLPITKVQEINRLLPITKLPQTPSFVEGIVDLRGRILPVIDLRKRLNLYAGEHADDSRIIVVDIKGKTTGVIVDAVAEVVTITAAQIEPPPPSFVIEAQYINGVGKLGGRLLILLNIDRVLTDEEESEFIQLEDNM